MADEYSSLRNELKLWEKEFQAQHSRKATPDDIRLVEGLANKYKRFKALSKNATKPSGPSTKSDNPAPAASSSILKRPKIVEDDRDPLPQK
ncbi:2031_t:CDS:2, partial [Acaulospora colombiana]